MTVIPLGRPLPCASSTLPAGSAGHTSTPAYLGLLQVEIARFTQTELARLCCSDPHLAVDGGYPLPCPVESGLSSMQQVHSDRLARFRFHGITWGWGALVVYLNRRRCRMNSVMVLRPLSFGLSPTRGERGDAAAR